MKKIFIITILTICFFTNCYSQMKTAETNKKKGVYDHSALLKRISRLYPEQFTGPEKKNRKTFSQFGYNLYYFAVPIFPITKFITPGNFGYQSYGKPDRKTEKNGSLYTCRGGFIDFSHMRAGINWTVHIAFQMLKQDGVIRLPCEAGTLQLQFRDINNIGIEDIAAIAQNIAFERLLWHEVASWHYHKPYHKVSEQASAFSPEDIYSNMLGTVIGKNVALRLLRDSSHLSYTMAATEEIQKLIDELQPMETNRESRNAYDIIDLHKQRKSPAHLRNYDVWYDSRIVFRDQRHTFKRYTHIGPEISPWLVPASERLGCSGNPMPEVLKLPKYTKAGMSIYDFYEFRITPDTNMFYDYKNHKQLHTAFGTFTTNNYEDIMWLINREMAAKLGPDFNTRNCSDPTIHYTNVRRVFLK